MIEFPRYENTSTSAPPSTPPAASPINTVPTRSYSLPSIRSPMSISSWQGAREQVGPSEPRERHRSKGEKGQYSVQDILFLEWWETYHPEQVAAACSNHPEYLDSSTSLKTSSPDLNRMQIYKKILQHGETFFEIARRILSRLFWGSMAGKPKASIYQKVKVKDNTWNGRP